MTNEHTSLKKYTSHTLFEMFAKGLCVRSELATEQIATYWPPPQFLLSLAALLSRSAQSGILRAHSPLLGDGSLYSILSPTNWLQLTEPVYGPGLYNCLTSTCFLWASHLHPIHSIHSKVIPWSLRPDAPFIYTGASLIWQLGRVSICFSIAIVSRQWNVFNYCYLTLIILSNFNYLFADREVVTSITIYHWLFY